MTTFEIVEGRLKIEIVGWDKIWSFKSGLDFPIEHVVGARLWDGERDAVWRGIRAPGTYLPGVIVAGTYHWNGEHVFYDVHDFAKVIVIELKDEWYTRLVVQVDDPIATLRLLPMGLVLSQ